MFNKCFIKKWYISYENISRPIQRCQKLFVVLFKDINTYNLILMIEYSYALILIFLKFILKSPNFDSLIHWIANQLQVIIYKPWNIVIMRLKFLNNVIIFNTVEKDIVVQISACNYISWEISWNATSLFIYHRYR